MALDLGNILGAAANLTTAASQPKTLKNFLRHINDFGIQVTNNFEVNFSGLEDITFFVLNVSFGGITQVFEEVHYNGRTVPVPVVYDYDHSGSMTVINDANGYIYAAVTNFLMNNVSNELVDCGYTMTIKCLTGDDNYKGGLVTLNSVRLEKVDGLQFDYSGSDVSTFSVSFNYLDFEFTPGALGKAAGIIGAVNQIIK